MASISWNHSVEKYNTQHDRQIVGISIPDQPPDPSTNPRWVIFIHGGGWRDPKQTYKDFNPTLNLFLKDDSNKSTLSRISGFASIEYSLSPSPNHPDPAPNRNVKHPKHVEEVCYALGWLSGNYYIGYDYVLVGHSAGATMVFQIAMGMFVNTFKPPAAVVGLAGIYDIPWFIANVGHPERYEPYQQMIAGAFGDDEEVWRNASPALRGDLLGRWTRWRTEKVILSHSTRDGLVEVDQTERLRDILEQHGIAIAADLRPTSTHDEMWQNGRDVVDAIKCAFE